MALLVGGFAFALDSPAPAATDVCTINGTMVTAAPVFHIGLGPSASGPFAAAVAIGGCVLTGQGTWGGSFTNNVLGNYCQHATGQGGIGDNSFTFQWVGDQMVFSGSVIGTLEIQPLVFNGESCVSGADQFLLTGTLVLVGGAPPVTTTSVTTTPLPVGGPSAASDTCGGAGVSNENPVEFTVKANTSPIEVCVRAGPYGGKFTVMTSGGGLPSVPPVPTQDTDAGACASTGNTIGGSHPIVGPLEVDPGDHIVFIDAYAAGDQVWLCAKASTVAARFKITLPSGGGVPNVNVGFEPDPGTPDPI